jgi:pyruvyltransferase
MIAPLRRKRRNRVAAYWWIERPNAGDLLTPLLLQHFSNLTATWAPFAHAELVCVGSVLEHIPNGWHGKIVGAGKLRESSQVPVGPEILALRGPLTAKGIRGDFALGDPGLLANELVRVDTKKHELGVVPHWSDNRLAIDPRFTQYDPVVIDPRGDPLEFIRLIGESKKIVTSSLHGLAIADAFGIPRRFEYDQLELWADGGMFKFKDYSAAIRTPLEVGVTMQANRQAVDDRKSELWDVFRALARD